MCAVNGFTFEDRQLIDAMNTATKHRGPDGTGVFVDDKISLGHNRLSIIDTSEKANQPMSDTDGRFILTYNGEIYNFKELKEELSQKYKFITESDSEVILAAYRAWGIECVKKFDGIFAFAIWDKENKELFLARDEVGVKPLYYYWVGDRFIFSSEIKGILEHNIPRLLNKDAFSHYMRVLYVPEPLTMFQGIFKFPKGHYGVFKESNFTCVQFSREKKLHKKYVKPKKLEAIIRDTVEKQLVSDRPLGVYLSGGIDSSVVLEAVSQVRKKIDTFSVGFTLDKNEEASKFNADFDCAQKTAEQYKTNHHEVYVDPYEIIPLLQKAVEHLGEPISNPTIIPMIKLSEFVKKKGIDVVLGGDGGDELFGGYERYRLSLLMSLYQKLLPQFLRAIFARFDRRFKKLNIPSGILRYELFHFQKDQILKKVLDEDFFNKDTTRTFFQTRFFSKETINFEELFMNIDKKTWLVDESLKRTDHMAMAHGVEARVPLLGKDIVDFSLATPLQQKVTPFTTKKILKQAFRADLPNFLFKQPKRGWFSPAAKWLRYPHVKEFAEKVLSPEYCPSTKKLFRWSEIEDILNDHIEKREYNLTILWAIITFQVWAKSYGVEVV